MTQALIEPDIRAASEMLAAFEARSVEMPWVDAAELTRVVAGVQRSLGEPIRLSFVGNFSVGKSNIINSLLGEKIAPVGVRRTTAVICYFRYGQEKRLRMHFRDGTVQEEGLMAFAHFSDHRQLGAEEEAHIRSMAYVEVFYPSEALRNITLVDTPGFGSDAEADDEVTRGHLRDADAVCWVFDAQEVGKQDEVRRVRELAPLFRAAFAVVNKCDEKPAGERPRLKERVETLFEGCFDGVLLYSAELVQEAAREPELVDEDEIEHLCMDLRAEIEARVKAHAEVLRARYAEAELGQLARAQRAQVLAFVDTLASGLAALEAALPQALERQRRRLREHLTDERRALERRLQKIPERHCTLFEACIDVKDRIFSRNIEVNDAKLLEFQREMHGSIAEAFEPWREFVRQAAARTLDVVNSVDLGEVFVTNAVLAASEAQLVEQLEARVRDWFEGVPDELSAAPMHRLHGNLDGFVRTLYALRQLPEVVEHLAELKGVHVVRFVVSGFDWKEPLVILDERLANGGLLLRHIDDIEGIVAGRAGELRARIVDALEFVSWLDAEWPSEGAAAVTVARSCASCGGVTRVPWPASWPRCGQCERELAAWPLVSPRPRR